MSTATFGINTARDYFENILVPNYEDFLKSQLDVKEALTCSIILWHQKDWVWSSEEARLQSKFGIKDINDFHNFIFSKCPDLKIIQELATHNDIQVAQKEDGFASGLSAITTSFLTLKIDGSTLFIIKIFKNVMNYWKELISTLET